jgi:branched-chain amino acid transport system substrate-binding protein
MQSYDSALLIDSAVRATHGNLSDRTALAKAMSKADFHSARGPFSFNVNHFPIQDYYQFEVVRGSAGKPVIKTGKVIFKAYKDPYYKDCKMTF